MKHLATIQTEFLKEASHWDDLSIDEQKNYLKQHPKSKKRITAKPDSHLSNFNDKFEKFYTTQIKNYAKINAKPSTILNNENEFDINSGYSLEKKDSILNRTNSLVSLKKVDEKLDSALKDLKTYRDELKKPENEMNTGIRPFVKLKSDTRDSSMSNMTVSSEKELNEIIDHLEKNMPATKNKFRSLYKDFTGSAIKSPSYSKEEKRENDLRKEDERYRKSI